MFSTVVAMRRLVLPLVCICCLLGSVGAGWFGWRESQFLDRLVLDPPVHVVGDIRQGETVESVFRIRNATRETVLLDSPLQSCSCQVARMGNQTLAAGEISEIRLTTEIGARRGSLETGSIVQYRVGQERLKRRIDLVVRGNVLPDYEFEPAVIRFQNGLESSVRVSVSPTDRFPDLFVSSVFCSRPCFKVSSIKRDGHKAWTIDVTFKPESTTEKGESETALLIETNSHGQPQLRIPIEIKNETSNVAQR